jgi:hypothetical protein
VNTTSHSNLYRFLCEEANNEDLYVNINTCITFGNIILSILSTDIYNNSSNNTSSELRNDDMVIDENNSTDDDIKNSYNMLLKYFEEKMMSNSSFKSLQLRKMYQIYVMMIYRLHVNDSQNNNKMSNIDYKYKSNIIHSLISFITLNINNNVESNTWLHHVVNVLPISLVIDMLMNACRYRHVVEYIIYNHMNKIVTEYETNKEYITSYTSNWKSIYVINNVNECKYDIDMNRRTLSSILSNYLSILNIQYNSEVDPDLRTKFTIFSNIFGLQEMSVLTVLSQFDIKSNAMSDGNDMKCDDVISTTVNDVNTVEAISDSKSKLSEIIDSILTNLTQSKCEEVLCESWSELLGHYYSSCNGTPSPNAWMSGFYSNYVNDCPRTMQSSSIDSSHEDIDSTHDSLNEPLCHCVVEVYKYIVDKMVNMKLDSNSFIIQIKYVTKIILDMFYHETNQIWNSNYKNQIASSLSCKMSLSKSDVLYVSNIILCISNDNNSNVREVYSHIYRDLIDVVMTHSNIDDNINAVTILIVNINKEKSQKKHAKLLAKLYIESKIYIMSHICVMIRHILQSLLKYEDVDNEIINNGSKRSRHMNVLYGGMTDVNKNTYDNFLAHIIDFMILIDTSEISLLTDMSEDWDKISKENKNIEDEGDVMSASDVQQNKNCILFLLKRIVEIGDMTTTTTTIIVISLYIYFYVHYF